jgi:hypothetical protein
MKKCPAPFVRQRAGRPHLVVSALATPRRWCWVFGQNAGLSFWLEGPGDGAKLVSVSRRRGGSGERHALARYGWLR